MKEWVVVLALAVSVPAAFAAEYPDLGVRVDTVAEGLDVPWSVAWTPDGSMLFTERAGQLRVVQDGVLQDEPVLSLDVGDVEGGLLGVAVDPGYQENNYIYLYYTDAGFLQLENRLVRYVYDGSQIREDGTVVDGIPGGPYHDGGRIKFGPDGKLYVTTGDAGLPDLSQDPGSLGGKILRVNPDGTIPRDNPFGDSPVYSLGHRNPQGLDWDASGNLVITEHGPSGWQGTGRDEINLVTPGSNYGWPEVSGDGAREGMTGPILHTGDEVWAPSGAAFYDSDAIPQWTGKYFVAALRGSHLHMVEFDLENNAVLSDQRLFEGDFGRLRDVAVGPDGSLYVLTSNRDGRGNPQANDDRILKISPASRAASFAECVAAGNPVMESYPRQCATPDGLWFVEDVGAETCKGVSGDDPVFITTGMGSYGVGDVLSVGGCVDTNAVQSGEINLVVLGPAGQVVAAWPVPVGADGTFAGELALDGEAFPVNGTYSVVGEIDGRQYATTAFTVPEFGAVALLALGAGLVAVMAFRVRPYRKAGPAGSA